MIEKHSFGLPVVHSRVWSLDPSSWLDSTSANSWQTIAGSS
uniref:Uncharacterized protein n=1 Tax=Anguilla anguilla TaxID=7936 RepID=A0A0E9SD22_ANGAN